MAGRKGVGVFAVGSGAADGGLDSLVVGSVLSFGSEFGRPFRGTEADLEDRCRGGASPGPRRRVARVFDRREVVRDVSDRTAPYPAAVDPAPGAGLPRRYLLGRP